MKKERIVIASVLKPVDDTRMAEKIGMSLRESGAYEVFIVGYPSEKQLSESPGVLPLPRFKRASFGRLRARAVAAMKIFRVRPHVLIVNTHELLVTSIACRIFLGTKIVYDIRENYFRNIIYSGVFPRWIAPLVAAGVRTKEKLTAPLFHGFLLAEAGYLNEMRFFHEPVAVIENKAIVPPGHRQRPSSRGFRLLFSGTLSESTGVFRAISFAKRLHAADPTTTLTLIGYCAILRERKKIEDEIKGCSFVRMIGGDHLVPHPEIAAVIYSSDFGILSYPPSRHTENSIPTKLYEYLACALPILLPPHPPWWDRCQPFAAGIAVDFEHDNAADLIQKMKTSVFYTRPPVDVTWDSEGKRLLSFLSKIKNT